MQCRRWKKRRGNRVVGVAVLLALLAGLAVPVQAARKKQTWCFPLDTAEWHISDTYGERTDPFTGQTAFHHGLDLACGEGTGVRAVQDGVVRTATSSTSYGNYLCVLHPDGQETRYAHLQYLYVRPGTVVQAGQLLGTVGQTGRATGPHLHLELWEQGTAQDPAPLLETAP